MDRLTDQQLLREYRQQRSESAFAELVQRHVDLVYSAALRMVRDPHLAEDVTQAVFVELAKQSAKLESRPVLAGWLHRTSQNLASKLIRSDVRRRAREHEAGVMNELHAHAHPEETEVPWDQIAPHLDSALGQLSESDRDALLLRFFQRQSARQIAETLGTTEEAAQKRVTRAIERIRTLLSQRGAPVGAGSLALILSAHAVQAAPAGLTTTITATAAGSGISSGSIVLKWITAKTVAAALTGVVIIGASSALLLTSADAKRETATPKPTASPGKPAARANAAVAGILKTAEGKPVASAEVYLATPFAKVPVYAQRSDKVQTTVTDAQGRFTFPADDANRAVIVLNEKGYAQASMSELATEPEVILQPWARIQGQLREGSQLMANQVIHLSRTRFGSKQEAKTYCTVHDTTTVTDGEGRYVFERVAPGDTWISWRKGGDRYDVQYRYVDVQPGKSLTVDIGGRGRPVIGRAALQEDGNAKPVKFYGSIWPRTDHQMRPPPNWRELSPEEQEKLTAEWEKTPDAKIYNQERCPIDFRIEEDGSFTVPDLPSGAYRLVVINWAGAPVRSAAVARGTSTIVIPEVPGGHSDEPLDIGTVEAFYTRPLQRGDLAPAFEAKTLDGRNLKLSDYKGKYLLVHFWRSDRPETTQDFPDLKAAQKEWSTKKGLEILGINFDESADSVRDFMKANEITWTQCIVTRASDIQNRFRLRGPTTLLIGPDGRILQANLHGVEITEGLKESLSGK